MRKKEKNALFIPCDFFFVFFFFRYFFIDTLLKQKKRKREKKGKTALGGDEVQGFRSGKGGREKNLISLSTLVFVFIFLFIVVCCGG